MMLKRRTLTTAGGELRPLICSPLNSGLLQSLTDHTKHLIVAQKG